MNVLAFYEENQAKNVLNTPDQGSNNLMWNLERGEAQHWNSEGAYQCAIWPPRVCVKDSRPAPLPYACPPAQPSVHLFLPLDESCLPFPLLLLSHICDVHGHQCLFSFSPAAYSYISSTSSSPTGFSAFASQVSLTKAAPLTLCNLLCNLYMYINRYSYSMVFDVLSSSMCYKWRLALELKSPGGFDKEGSPRILP